MIRPISILRNGEGTVLLVQWVALGAGDEGAPLELCGWADRSVQACGNFGGATLRWEGSNNGVDYCTLNDPQGVALNLTGTCVKGVLEACRYARPKVIGGNEQTNLETHVFIRRSAGLSRIVKEEMFTKI
jgi:hypothetical protein